MKPRIVLATILLLLPIVFLILFPRSTLLIIAYGITILYLGWGLYHIPILVVGAGSPFNPGTNPQRFPKISLIIPARNEPILSRTAEVCLKHVDYPEDRKEILIVTEDPEGGRVATWYSQLYPGRVIPVIRREFFLTKPSALNDSIAFCGGEIVGVIDVEDVPERDTFLKVASAFTNHGFDVVQVILRISNQDDNWITHLFAMEYAGWFRVWLNGRSKLGLFTPLGGTGNYIRSSLISEVGRWDPLNLAEDAEITLRFYMSGRRSVLIDARHWEEAPTTFKAWLRQRTRWFRGWTQSLIKHFRYLVRFSALRKLGIAKALSILFMLVAPIIVVLNWIAYGMTIWWLLEYFSTVPFSLTRNLFPWWALLPLLFNGIYYYALAKGALLERVCTVKTFLKYFPHMLFYINFMMPVAALRAFYQELFREVYWEKTAHPGRGVRWPTF